MPLKRLVHNEDDFLALAEQLNLAPDLLERDFVLVTIAGELAEQFPDALCFKGGFVLRHVFGLARTSRDVDATRHEPPKHKFEAEDVAGAIREAARRGNFQVDVPAPATDSARSLDFDGISYKGMISSSTVDVEVSYREEVQLDPVPVKIGPPFYEEFEIPAMAAAEIVAEKLRTLAQRQKPSDLDDLAQLIDRHAEQIEDRLVATVVPVKFAPGLVRDGDHRQRILDNIEAMRPGYEAAVRAVSDEPIPHEDALRLVKKKLPIWLAQL